MEIEFDPEKSERNRALRGFGFDGVAEFDFETALVWIDTRKDYGEDRFIALGWVTKRVYAVVFTETKNGIRVISFRKANDREARKYEQGRSGNG
jgi:uncharacterized protein